MCLTSKVNRKSKNICKTIGINFKNFIDVLNGQILFARKRSLKEAPSNKRTLETTKGEKLTKLARFDLEMKKDSIVPKDRNFHYG